MSFVNINGLIENNDNVTQDVITDTATTPTTATTNINLENQNNVPVIGTDNNIENDQAGLLVNQTNN